MIGLLVKINVDQVLFHLGVGGGGKKNKKFSFVG
jgi:hypothetical protein